MYPLWSKSMLQKVSRAHFEKGERKLQTRFCLQIVEMFVLENIKSEIDQVWGSVVAMNFNSNFHYRRILSILATVTEIKNYFLFVYCAEKC